MLESYVMPIITTSRKQQCDEIQLTVEQSDGVKRLAVLS